MSNVLKLFLIKILKESFLLLSLYNTYYRLRNKKRFWKEINRRQALSMFDYKELVKPIPYYPIEAIKDSNFMVRLML